MNILLLGGTGAMGEHLTAILSKSSENQVFVTTRSKRKNYYNVTYVQGNAMDDGFIKPLLQSRKWGSVVDFMIYTTDAFRDKVDMFLNATNQYIYISSSRVYDNSDTPIKETSNRLLDSCKDSKYLKTDEYALTKARQENILLQSGRKNWTIIRPYVTFSEIRLQLGVLEKENWLYRALKGRTIVFSKDILEKRTTLTYGYDVARGISAILNNPKACGEAYHITVGESHTWGEILNVYLDVLEQHLGKRPNVLILEEHPFQHVSRPFYQLIYDRHYNRVFDNSKINEFIDTSTFTPTLEGLRECLTKFLASQNFRSINWRGDAGRDRLTHEIANLGDIPNLKTKIKYLIQRFVMPYSYF